MAQATYSFHLVNSQSDDVAVPVTVELSNPDIANSEVRRYVKRMAKIGAGLALAPTGSDDKATKVIYVPERGMDFADAELRLRLVIQNSQWIRS